MSLSTSLGTERNLFDETPEHAHKLELDQPILLNRELETLRHISSDVFSAAHDRHHLAGRRGARGAERARSQRVCARGRTRRSPRASTSSSSPTACSARPRVAIPSLLAVSSVHHHLVREGTRLRAGIVLESGEPREVHHFATLIGYGASAINPYLMLETLDELVAQGASCAPSTAHDARPPSRPRRTRSRRSARGCSRRSPRWASRRSSPTAARRSSRPSAWSPSLIDRHFTGTASRIGGIGLDVLAVEALERHARAYPAPHDDLLPVGGIYAWRRDGEHHMWNPETIALVQHAVRSANGNVAARSRAIRSHESVRDSPAFRSTASTRRRQRGRRPQGDPAGAVATSGESTARTPIALERGRAGQGDREALLHRRDEPRLDLPRGARDACDRDEPARRALQHRRGWGGPGALHARPQRRPAPLGDQAGRLGALRGDDPLPGQRRRAADQDGPGRQARRGRPAARATRSTPTSARSATPPPASG